MASTAKKITYLSPPFVNVHHQLNKYFTFEVTILDDKNVRRRFRASTFQSCTRVKPFICVMPMHLDEGWNQIQFNLADFTRRAYGTNYVETLRVQIHANCRLRRIYFSDRLYCEEELPAEFKVFLPITPQDKAGSEAATFAGNGRSLRVRRRKEKVLPPKIDENTHQTNQPDKKSDQLNKEHEVRSYPAGAV
jgi:hypothetical protein